MILIYDYGVGNLLSVSSGLQRAGADVVIGQGAELIGRADKIVLPGVGSFGAAMTELDTVRDVLTARMRSGTPILGICLGMQVMFEGSEEAPEAAGLGWAWGRAVKFVDGIVPHMGWSYVQGLDEWLDSGYYYFAHSYHVLTDDKVAAVCDRPPQFVAGISSGNVWGVQFHPEKSQEAGAELLQRFVDGRIIGDGKTDNSMS